jgi:hypothetical protein
MTCCLLPATAIPAPPTPHPPTHIHAGTTLTRSPPSPLSRPPCQQEIEEEQYVSALPFLPPLTETTLNTYYTVYAAFFVAVIVFGALLAPLAEVRGWAGWAAELIRCWLRVACVMKPAAGVVGGAAFPPPGRTMPVLRHVASHG